MSTATLILALCGLSASASSPSSCQPAARRVHGGRGRRRRAAAVEGAGVRGCRDAQAGRRVGQRASCCARACLLQLLHHHLDRQRVPATPPPHTRQHTLRAARLRPVPAQAARGGAGDAGGAQRGGMARASSRPGAAPPPPAPAGRSPLWTWRSALAQRRRVPGARQRTLCLRIPGHPLYLTLLTYLLASPRFIPPPCSASPPHPPPLGNRELCRLDTELLQ